MKQISIFVKIFILTIFMLPGIVGAQAIKDSIRNNYTQQNYKNYLLKKQRGEIPSHYGVVSSMRANGDILVNNNAGLTETGLYTQSETSIVAFGNNIVIGFNDSGSRDGDADKFTGWSYSSDGGASFTDGGTLPDDATGDAGDPVLARDETTGRIYFSTLGFTGDKTIQVFSSDDDGVTWSAPVNGTPGGNNEDKQWIVVDNFAGTGNGNVYLISRRFGGPAADQGVYVFYSTDNGATFLPDGGLKIASSGQGSYVAVAPNHDVYIFWRDSGSQSILMSTSNDYGVSFGAPVTALSGLSGTQSNGGVSLTGIRQGFVGAAGFRSNSFPHAAVNPISGHIYVTVNDVPAGADKTDIFMVMSSDEGATWSARVRVNDDATATDQWQPTITVTPDGENLGIFYSSREEDSDDNNLYKYYGRIASISGSTVTFEPSFAISDELSLPEFGRDSEVNSTYMGDYNHVAASGDMFHIVWASNLDDLPDGGDRKDPNVYYQSIPDGSSAPPEAVCQNVMASADENCQAIVTADQVDDGSYAPDGGDITLNLSPAGPYSLGDTEVTLTVTDESGDTDECTATITVTDNTPPVPPSPPADVTVQCAGDTPAPIDLTAMDNCDGAITVSPYTQFIPGDCDNDFVFLRSWTFTDLEGNTITIYQTITVNDDTAPVAPAPPADINVQCASDVPSPVDLTASDNCDGDITVSPSVSVTPGTCTNDFVEVRTWTFSDICGNTSSVSQTITVNDDTAPVAPAPPDDLFLQCASDVPDPVDLTAVDNCDGNITVSPTINVTPGISVNDFVEVRTWTFTDICGNTSSINQTITVYDDTPPVLTVISDPITLWPPNHKYVTINISQLFVDVVDNCSSLTIDDVYITNVSSDEDEDANGNGDGKTLNDIVIESLCSSVDLRKERNGNGNGRVYTVNLAVYDENGNIGTANCQVHVPHSNNKPAIDDGPAYSEECDKSSLISFNRDDVQLMNYPNPFNGNTTISFKINEANYTTLIVYDTYGKHVATLFDDKAEEGQQYKFEFSAGNLPKGIYIYHLQSGNNISVVKKMILMR